MLIRAKMKIRQMIQVVIPVGLMKGPPEIYIFPVIRHVRNITPVKILIANLDAVYPMIFAVFGGGYSRQEM